MITFRNILGSKETASTDVILSFKGEEVLTFVGKHFETTQLEILYCEVCVSDHNLLK
jgi:hypothetical protein